DNARTGVLEGNPIHEDMLFAAKSAKLAFILNVVIDAEQRVIAAFAGDSVKAHERGCEYARKRASVKMIPGAKIVVTTNGGYPLDQNIYQSVKGMTAAEATCAEGGVIIMVAACSEGHGGESFYRTMAEAVSPAEVIEKVSRIPMDKTSPDQWELQILARIMNKFTVIMVTDMCGPEIIEAMHMKCARSIPEALEMAYEITGKDAKFAVIPDGVSVIVG
ncbi:MAG: lactate racemization operon protein LarA, partial [candidate division NC10 bacterium]